MSTRDRRSNRQADIEGGVCVVIVVDGRVRGIILLYIELRDDFTYRNHRAHRVFYRDITPARAGYINLNNKPKVSYQSEDKSILRRRIRQRAIDGIENIDIIIV